MLALIPIFLKPDEPFWDSSDGRSLMTEILNRFSRCTLFEKILFLTNRDDIADLLTSMGLGSVKTEMTEVDHPPLPDGFNTALKHAYQSGANNNVLILNFRNPLLTENILESAIEFHNQSESPVTMSLTEVEDHPSQYTSYLDSLDMALIHTVDTRPSFELTKDLPTGWTLTRPFPYQWPFAVDSSSAPAMFTRTMGLRGPLFNYLNPAHRTSSIIWIAENASTARLAVPPEFCEPGMVAFSLDGARNKPGWKIFRAADGPLRLGHSRPPEGGSFRVRITSITTGSAHCDNCLDINVTSFTPPAFLPGPDKLPDAQALVLAREVPRGEFDLQEFFPSVPDLWHRYHKVLINAVTGERITSRQGFPEVLYFDGSMIMGRLRDIQNLQTLMTNAQASGFVMDYEGSPCIETHLDALKYRACLKAREHAQS